MRLLCLPTFFFVAISAAYAQTNSPQMQGSAPVPFVSPKAKLPDWQIAEWSAHVKDCVRHYGPTHHPVSLSVTIGRDGMIVGAPEIASPIDADDFRNDVKTVVLALHQCEPLIVDPLGIAKGPYIQRFNFPAHG